MHRKRYNGMLNLRTEMAKRGFVFDPTDFSWRNPKGAICSDEALEDIEAVWGEMGCKLLLDAFDRGAYQVSFGWQELPDGIKLNVQTYTLQDILALSDQVPE